MWHSLFGFNSPAHLRLPLFPSTRKVDFKSKGWCWDRQRHLRRLVRLQVLQQRRHHQAKSMRHQTAHFRASSHVTFTFQTINPFRIPRSSMLKLPHSTYTKIVCVDPTLTSSYRHLANSYTLLLNDSTTYTKCWPGVESSYTSICLSFGNSLYVILQRWLNTYRYARIYQSTAYFKCV